MFDYRRRIHGLRFKQVLNSVFNLVEEHLRLRSLHSFPQVVDVVPTKRCNLNCIFCKDYKTEGDQRINFSNFRVISEHLFRTAVQISFCSGGEPYLNSDLIEMLRWTREHNVQAWVLSNGMTLNESTIKTIVNEDLVWCHGFSVDGIKPSTVESIRVNAKLDKIIHNIQSLIKTRNNAGKTFPSIKIRYALMRKNIEELPEALNFWGKAGVKAIDCEYVSLCNDIDKDESLFYHQDLTENIFKIASKVASKFPHMKLSLPMTPRQYALEKFPIKRCPNPWRFVMIDTNGRVLPCYKSWGVLTAGNLFSSTTGHFRSLWNNNSYYELRRTVNNDKVKKLFPYCAVCEVRHGMSHEFHHLGDSTWIEKIDLSDAEKYNILLNRKRNKTSKNE